MDIKAGPVSFFNDSVNCVYSTVFYNMSDM